MVETKDAGGIVERLRRNERANSATFEAAGISRSDIPHVRCRSCDNYDSALFWTPARVDRGKLHLSCPACGDHAVRYDLARNEVDSRGVRIRARGPQMVVLQLVLWVGLVYWLMSPGGQDVADRLRELARSVGGGSPASPAFGPRGAPAGGAAGGIAAGEADGASVSLLAAAGDRRVDIEALQGVAVARYGPSGELVISRLEYLPDEDVTLLAVDTLAPAWLEVFADPLRSSGGWEVVGDPGDELQTEQRIPR